jgi:hypothetical protein
VKKTICLVGIGLLLVSMVLLGCASMMPGPKPPSQRAMCPCYKEVVGVDDL